MEIMAKIKSNLEKFLSENREDLLYLLCAGAPIGILLVLIGHLFTTEVY